MANSFSILEMLFGMSFFVANNQHCRHQKHYSKITLPEPEVTFSYKAIIPDSFLLLHK